MGIASLSRSPLLSALLTPLHALAARWMPSQPPRPSSSSQVLAFRRNAANDASATKIVAIGDHPARAAGLNSSQLTKATAPRRLKVVREFEAGISPSCAGRMVISGRMADVCAELDRMAQKEATRALAA